MVQEINDFLKSQNKYLNRWRRFAYIPLLSGAYLVSGNEVLTRFGLSMLFSMIIYDIYIEIKKRMVKR